MRTSELQGAALDWAVAKCEGYTGLHKIAGRMPHEPQLGIWPPRKEYGVMDLWELGFSTDWAKAGPIIERERIHLTAYHRSWGAYAWPNHTGEPWPTDYEERVRLSKGKPASEMLLRHGSTPLIAAMRCYVASKLGDEVDVPDELLQGEQA